MLFPSPPESIRAIFSRDERYLARSRFWRIGGVRPDEHRIIARLGYETEDETDLYDPVTHDFKREAVLRGRTVTFVVRLEDLAVVYERRRAAMSEQEFATGLRVVLRAADPHSKWEVVPVDNRTTFEDWARGVDCLNRFRYRKGAEGQSVSGVDSSSALGGLLWPRPGLLTIDFRSGDGANVDDEAFKQLVRLAEKGWGEVLAVGRRSNQGGPGVVKAWESTRSAERLVEEIPLDEDDSVESSESRLLEVLATVAVDPPW
jgi:hypothetical protein